VIALSKALNRHRYWVVGALVDFWAWAWANTKDGRLNGVSFKDIDRLIGRRGFAENLSKIGWLSRDVGGAAVIPRFSRWFVRSGADRSSDDQEQPSLYECSNEVSAPRGEQKEKERKSSNSAEATKIPTPSKATTPTRTPKATKAARLEPESKGELEGESEPRLNAAAAEKSKTPTAAATVPRSIGQVLNFAKEIEARGLPPAIARRLAATVDPNLVREALRFHREELEAKKLKNPPGALRGMLERPEKWGFEQTPAGWKAPQRSGETDRKSDALNRLMAELTHVGRAAREQAERDFDGLPEDEQTRLKGEASKVWPELRANGSYMRQAAIILALAKSVAAGTG
jgi:hypothetical protein